MGCLFRSAKLSYEWDGTGLSPTNLMAVDRTISVCLMRCRFAAVWRLCLFLG